MGGPELKFDIPGYGDRQLAVSQRPKIAGNPLGFCTICVSNYKQAEQEKFPQGIPEVLPGITMIASPVVVRVKQGMLQGIISVPACYEHIGVSRQSNLLTG
jgi:hypothetical protein